MGLVVQLLGLCIVGIVVVMVIRPALVRDLVPSLTQGIRLYIVATLRLLAGCVMIAAAHDARHPLAMEIIGWIAVTAGLLMVVIPPKVMARIGALTEQLTDGLVRLLSPVALAFGGYLIYAFL